MNLFLVLLYGFYFVFILCNHLKYVYHFPENEFKSTDNTTMKLYKKQKQDESIANNLNKFNVRFLFAIS